MSPPLLWLKALFEQRECEAFFFYFFLNFIQRCFAGKSSILSLDPLCQNNGAGTTREAEDIAGQSTEGQADGLAAWSSE